MNPPTPPTPHTPHGSASPHPAQVDEAHGPTGRVSRACAHCGLPVETGGGDDASVEVFCCLGCEAARHAILECGLEQYYKLRDANGQAAPEPVGASDTPGGVFERESFRVRHVVTLSDGSESAEVRLEGVHCVGCLWLIERLPRVVPGLISVEFDFSRSLAKLRWHPGTTTLTEIARRLSRFGYPAYPVEASPERGRRRVREHRTLAEIGVAAACMGNAMLLAFALYSGDVAEPYASMFHVLSAALALVSVSWPGRVFFRGAIAAARARTWSLDMPIALALGAGLVGGLVSTVRGEGFVYFDSITMLVLFLLIGRWLQERQQHRAREAVELLFATTPKVVRVVDEVTGAISELPGDEVHRGDLVEALPESNVPVDGIIESGESAFDESMLTGESNPVTRRVGEPVAAGTTNLVATVRVRVTASGRETRLGKVMDLIERLSHSSVPVVGSAERIAGPFMGIVTVLAGACLLLHTLVVGSGIAVAIEHTISLLIVVCPCAVAIATPLATSVAIARLASRGILVKGGHVLEVLARSPRALLDKTGTLTTGRFCVESWSGDERLKPVVAALEAQSRHPVGRALAGIAEPTLVSGIRTHTGLGVCGYWQGRRVAVGSWKFMRSLGIDARAGRLGDRGAGGDESGRVLVALDSAVVAEARVRDEIRPEAFVATEALRSFGWTLSIASGDEGGPVQRVARALAVDDATGSLSPEDKLEMVERSRGRGATVFVGDGVNDASALATADVGIAVHGGAEASLVAADAYLNRSGLGPLVELVEASRHTTSRIRLCLFAGLGYNTIAATLALAGLVSPVLAAILMPVSSLTVLALASTSAGGTSGRSRSTMRSPERTGAPS